MRRLKPFTDITLAAIANVYMVLIEEILQWLSLAENKMKNFFSLKENHGLVKIFYLQNIYYILFD